MMHVKLEYVLEVLSSLIPYDMMVNAFAEAEALLSNDVVFHFGVRCTRPERCFITKMELLIKYDYVNDSVLRVVMEVYLSPELTVEDFFGGLSRVVSRFKGDFELSRDVVKLVFSLHASKLGEIFEIIKSLMDALRLDFELLIESYEVLVQNEG
ncbi:MAG: hypothetical protein QXY36_03705 [Sulfolobales archaeon]